MFATFTKLLGTTKRAEAKPASREVRLEVEALEDRLAPAVVTTPYAIAELSAGNIHIQGNKFADHITVQTTSIHVFVVQQKGSESRVIGLWPRSAVFGGNIYFSGYDGNDSFQNKTSLKSNAWGGNGDDTMIGGSAQDFFDGEAGNDKLFGGGGRDFLFGGANNDFLDGGGSFTTGVYTQFFDGQADFLSGGTGADKFVAEWVSGPTALSYKNLDAPVDFNAGELDVIANPKTPSLIIV